MGVDAATSVGDEALLAEADEESIVVEGGETLEGAVAGEIEVEEVVAVGEESKFRERERI